MADSFIGEIDIFAFNYAPYGWAFADGSTLAISQYNALYALIGVAYGGNGQTNFMVPNLSERGACGQGVGPGLTPRLIGETFGAFSETLQVNEMPAHGHGWTLQNGADPRIPAPVAGSYLATSRPQVEIYLAGQPNAAFSPKTIAPQGGSQAHDNRQPYLAMNFCICLTGAFPAFS